MLTRLKVSGFKNLVDVDVRFGPFTCIAGANGVGKSNLFDAIRFLSALADQPLVDAALSVRDEGSRTGDIRSLFYRAGEFIADRMTFEAEMIIPAEGVDDLGQVAKASITFVRYALTLAYRRDDQLRSLGALELIGEELSQINIGDARDHLRFPHSAKWRRSAVQGRRTSALITTTGEGPQRVVIVHQDGRPGRPRSLLAANLPRTALSASNAAETPTVLLARREMQSWRQLQLEPSAMRRPDDFKAPNQLGVDGSHLAATLYYLARLSDPQDGQDREAAAAQVYAQAANRLAQLIDDVREVWIDRDDRRELLTLFVSNHDRTPYSARALSDGTLRFLALTVLALDPRQRGVICLEEPENGIHPERIPAMLRLLQDIAVDPQLPIGADNPLRQVIVNTHAPAVVQQVPDDSLLVAEPRELVADGQRGREVRFAGLPGTWRAQIEGAPAVPIGKLLAYLNPVAAAMDTPFNLDNGGRERRVVDREDMQQLLLPFEPA
ncbi:MAG TPA: AAA family ATPase [Roseiflexaceae bacterium]|nr:AAA family ATPase [Roseiflexaceae bacterium]